MPPNDKIFTIYPYYRKYHGKKQPDVMPSGCFLMA